MNRALILNKKMGNHKKRNILDKNLIEQLHTFFLEKTDKQQMLINK